MDIVVGQCIDVDIRLVNHGPCVGRVTYCQAVLASLSHVHRTSYTHGGQTVVN